MDCFAAQAHILATAAKFREAMAAVNGPEPANVNRFLVLLQRCGYSQRPTYAIEMATLIRELDLTQYDLAAGNPAVQ